MNKEQKKKVLDNIIKMLELLKEQNDILEITHIPPHIEEMFNDYNATYGICKTSFEITFQGMYKRIKE